MRKINTFFVTYASLVLGATLGAVACGDTITNVSTGGSSGADGDGGKADITVGTDSDTGADPNDPNKDSSVPDTSGPGTDSSVPVTCTTGQVRCAGGIAPVGGVAQECFAGVWKNTAAACVEACSQPAGTWMVDRLQPDPAPVNVRRGADKILLTRSLSAPMTFADAKTYCTQFGDQSNGSSRWGLPYVELSYMSPDPAIPGCNPIVDQAAFPGMAPNTEVWVGTGNLSVSYVYSFATNSATPVNDSTLRPVICRKLLP